MQHAGQHRAAAGVDGHRDDFQGENGDDRSGKPGFLPVVARQHTGDGVVAQVLAFARQQPGEQHKAQGQGEEVPGGGDPGFEAGLRGADTDGGADEFREHQKADQKRRKVPAAGGVVIGAARVSTHSETDQREAEHVEGGDGQDDPGGVRLHCDAL